MAFISLTGTVMALRLSMRSADGRDRVIVALDCDPAGQQRVIAPGGVAGPSNPPPQQRTFQFHEVVKIDYFLPGCPPSGDTIWTFLTELLEGKPVSFPYTQIHYD